MSPSPQQKLLYNKRQHHPHKINQFKKKQEKKPEQNTIIYLFQINAETLDI